MSDIRRDSGASRAWDDLVTAGKVQQATRHGALSFEAITLDVSSDEIMADIRRERGTGDQSAAADG